MNKIGFAITMLGLSLADSECIIVPLVVVALGALILWRSDDAR